MAGKQTLRHWGLLLRQTIDYTTTRLVEPCFHLIQMTVQKKFSTRKFDICPRILFFTS